MHAPRRSATEFGVCKFPEGSVEITTFTHRITDTKVAAMATEFDPSEFVDDDFQRGNRRTGSSTTMVATATAAPAAPSREEMDARVGDMQSKLAELKRAQQELE